jgi:hypothetical protein
MRVAEKPGALRAIAAFFAHSGDSWFWGAALILLWLVSDSSWRRWEVVELVGISLLAVLVMGIKFIVRRQRPGGNGEASIATRIPTLFRPVMQHEHS